MKIDRAVYDCQTGLMKLEEINIVDEFNPIAEVEQTLSDGVRIEHLENESRRQEELLNMLMLAADEMFSLIEPLISIALLSDEETCGSRIVEMYIAMIERNLKTLEDVPKSLRGIVAKGVK